MAGKRRQFTLEFKLEAVQLASTSKKPLAQVARELGIRPEMLRTWRRRYYERKRAEGKTNLAALRCLKRVLAGIVYYRLRAAGQVVSRMDAQSESNGTTAMAA